MLLEKSKLQSKNKTLYFYIIIIQKRVKDTDEDDEESDEDKEDIVHQINRNRVDSDTLLGIDQAILQSIDASGTY